MQIKCRRDRAGAEARLEDTKFTSIPGKGIPWRGGLTTFKKKIRAIDNISMNIFKKRNFAKPAIKFNKSFPQRAGHNRIKTVKRMKSNEEDFFEIPSTPHNTSQYLISNFVRARKDNVMNLISNYTNYLEKDIYSMLTDEILTVDDICVSGGSMKGLINLENEYVNLTQTETEIETVTETEDNTLTTRNMNLGLEEESIKLEDDGYYLLEHGQENNNNCNNFHDNETENLNRYFNLPSLNEEMNYSTIIVKPECEFELQIYSQHQEIQILLQKLKKKEFRINDTGI